MKKVIIGAAFALFANVTSAQEVTSSVDDTCSIAGDLAVPIAQSRIDGDTKSEVISLIHNTSDASYRVREIAEITTGVIYSVPFDLLVESTPDQVWEAVYQRCITDMTSVEM